MGYIIHLDGILFNAYVSKSMDINDKYIRNINAMYKGPGWTTVKNDMLTIVNYFEASKMFEKVVDIMLKDYEYNRYTDELIREKDKVIFKYRSGIWLFSLTFTLENV